MIQNKPKGKAGAQGEGERREGREKVLMHKLAPSQRTGETEDRGRPLQVVGGGFSKSGNEFTRLVLGDCKTS